MPCLLETTSAGSSGSWNVGARDHGMILLAVLGLSLWLSLVGFFASSLAQNFLQAVGFAIATFIVSVMSVPALAERRMIFFDSLPVHAIMSLIIAARSLVFTPATQSLWMPNLVGEALTALAPKATLEKGL